MRRLADGSVALSWDEADALVDQFAAVGKPAVASWLRDRLDALAAEGVGPEHEIVMGLRPDREASN